MSAEKFILATLDKVGLVPLGAVISGGEGKPINFVTLSVSRDSSGKQVPSNATLHSVSKTLAEAGLNVEFLLKFEESEEIELGLRATILHSHIEHVRNIFVSFDSSSARVWLEPKHPLDQNVLEEIEGRVRIFLALFDVEFGEVLLTTEEVLPTKLALLTVVRQLAPASLTAIAVDLERRSLAIPSPDWLVRRLDALRKSGHVVRLSSGEFALTRHSLHVLGTTKNRTSPDITRLLALSRRGS